MSRRCRRIRAMKILVESVETGSAHISGVRIGESDSARRSRRVGRDRPSLRLDRLRLQTSSSAERLRSRSSTLPVKAFPGEVSASQPKLSPFIAPRPGPAFGRTLGAVNRSKGRIKLGETGACGRRPNSTVPLHSLRGLRFHTTMYRTSPFGNLSWFRKYRIYWRFENKYKRIGALRIQGNVRCRTILRDGAVVRGAIGLVADDRGTCES